MYIISYVFDNAFICFIGMGELILIEYLVHCGVFGVSGIGRIWGSEEGGCGIITW